MKDDEKTKAQLIEELEALRRKVAEFEAGSIKSGPESKEHFRCPKTRAPRVNLNAGIEFIGDFDVLEAKGINISEGGICFELTRNLPFEMQFELDGKLHRYRAHLVWVKQIEEGGCRFGLQFIEEKPVPALDL